MIFDSHSMNWRVRSLPLSFVPLEAKMAVFRTGIFEQSILILCCNESLNGYLDEAIGRQVGTNSNYQILLCDTRLEW